MTPDPRDAPAEVMEAAVGRAASTRTNSGRLVMQAVVGHGPISRAEIARRTGLSKQTISDAMRELECDGWVLEDGQVQGATGRSAVNYVLRAAAGHVLGIDLGGTKLHLGLADLSGALLDEAVEPTELGGGPAVVAQIGRMARGLLAGRGAAMGTLAAATMGSPGVVDPRSGGIGIAPNIPGLDGIDVPAALAQTLGVATVVENDVNLAALGEQWRGAHRAVGNFVFVALGTGIGMGIVSDGRLVRGGRGAAGEVAYLPVGGDPFDARNRRFGTLETAVGSVAIAARYRAAGGPPGATVRSMLDALPHDEAARATLAEVCRAVAAGLLAVCSVLDPEVVVLGGSIGARPEVRDGIAAALAACMDAPPQVAISALGSRAALTGAIGSAVATAHRRLFGISDVAERPLAVEPA